MLNAIASFALLLGAPAPPQPAAAASQGQEGISIGFGEGDLLPDLELPTLDGSTTYRLSNFRGKRLLLIQFASW